MEARAGLDEGGGGLGAEDDIAFEAFVGGVEEGGLGGD